MVAKMDYVQNTIKRDFQETLRAYVPEEVDFLMSLWSASLDREVRMVKTMAAYTCDHRDGGQHIPREDGRLA